MIIRDFTPADYKAVYTLWETTPGVGLRENEDSEVPVLKFLAKNPNTCFIAVEDEKIIGTILGGNDGKRGYIYHLAVDVNFRRRGIGKALVERTVEALKHEGINGIKIFVFRDNESGNIFWEKLGFVENDLAVTRTLRLD